ncbi:Bardet-Biedl syndrome 1 isoform 3-T5 [Glossina fuscipes fuscipes]
MCMRVYEQHLKLLCKKILIKAVDITVDDKEQYSGKLKVFRGLDLESEHELGGIPAAIESLYIDETESKTPILAVAIAESILFYRHMKPYFKYTLPELEILDAEREIWRRLSIVRQEDQENFVEALKAYERPKLCRKSQRLLQLLPEERYNFIRDHAEGPFNRFANVIALKCLARVSTGHSQPPSHLVVATDNGEVLIIEPQSFGILYKATVCPDTPPSVLAVHGTFETDFCVIIATRYGSVYLLRKACPEAQEIFKLSQPMTGLVLLPIDQTIVAAAMNKRLLCYSKKGKQLYLIPLGKQPICLNSINLQHLGLTLICVALEGGLVQFYMQKYLVDEFQTNGTVSSMLFGRMGWEEYVLCLTTIEGDLIVKILKRTATFEPLQNLSTRNILGIDDDMVDATILEKPKKSSIFVEQIAREKKNAKITYGSFQVELWRLRHTAARATVGALNSSEQTTSNDITHAPVKLSAEVCGAGSIFRVYLTIQNLSTYKMASNLTVLIHSDRRHYTTVKSLAKISLFQLPCILPGIPLKIDFEVVAVINPNDKLPPHSLTPDNSHIRIMLIKAQQAKPLIAAVIAIPTTI